jgi:5-methyltetrahydrofolate--homocysteine methyltransferase
MPRVLDSPDDFTIIGENIHATRVVLRNGRRAVTLDDGTEAVPFEANLGEDGSGEPRHLTVPDSFKETQPYQQGQIKHFMIAMQKGIGDDPDERAEGAAYVHYEVRRQVAAGAHFLDLNVDEISYRIEVQKRAMAWVVRTAQEVSPVPLSVDSSSPDIIAAGLAEYDGRAGRPMVNSVALERLETLDLVKEYDARVIVTAAGPDSMPQDDEERVANVGAVMDAVRSAGIPMADVYIDCIVFPISVSGDFGPHYLDAVAAVREAYGPDVHITGGLSNVSFGLPKRKLINDTFIHLGIEAGIDSGIMDPLQSKIERVIDLDLDSERVGLARDMLLGRDDFCMNYIQAFRDGKL